MGFGAITKQIAKEALGAQVEELIGGPRSPDSPKAEPAAADGTASLVLAELQKMQAALKDDKELLVQCNAAGETLRVVEVFAPSARLLVMTGLDAERTVTRVIAGADTVQLVCKPVPVKEGTKPFRLRLISAKA